MKSKEVIVEAMSASDNAVFEAQEQSKSPYDNMQKARAFATIAHAGATRKNNKTPYIVHPRRVVKTLQNAGVQDREILAAAYLHDVLEDTDSQIEGQFSDKVINLVKSLTKDKTSTKTNYLNSLSGAPPGAILIKMADRYDNLVDGSKSMPEGWLPKYLQSTKVLISVAEKSPDTKTPAGAKLLRNLKDLLSRLSPSDGSV